MNNQKIYALRASKKYPNVYSLAEMKDEAKRKGIKTTGLNKKEICILLEKKWHDFSDFSVNEKSWNQVLTGWYETPPDNFPNKSFLWNTSVINKYVDTPFEEAFLTDPTLPKDQDYSSFKNYINRSNNEYVVAFPNLGNTAMLVVPMPKNRKNFATLSDFNKNASEVQKNHFWKMVVKVIHVQKRYNENIWVSIHGHGVPYLHVRIDSKPRYYFDKDLAKNIYN